MSDYLGKDTPKLGFGLMRLPRVKGAEQDTIDVEETSRMVDAFLEAGLTYFDTAYVYGGSEVATGKALVARHPRNTYTIATKLNAGAAKDEADAKQQIYTSLERLGTDYIDYYLLHAIGSGNLPKYNEFGLWDYLKELKEKGIVRHYGFSFHDTPELLDQVLTDHPDVEFVQLQINYADWEDKNVQSRACYEVARKHGKPVVVMEPVKGGTLANLPEKIAAPMKEAAPDASFASWAIRFVASQEGILTVLSGMSNLAQMEDNLSYMKDFQPLSEDEYKIIDQVQKNLAAVPTIPCTACRYCTPGCPMEINIPGIFGVMNNYLIYQNLERSKGDYNWRTNKGGKASACIQCGQCEEQCPQHIGIIEQLVRAAETLE
ncbi:MAG: aldo/keto reductase [Firmicutes bacterium]|nr:aldo/keto reductase [Bacillota bacterium]